MVRPIVILRKLKIHNVQIAIEMYFVGKSLVYNYFICYCIFYMNGISRGAYDTVETLYNIESLNPTKEKNSAN